jgi:hypothetical protein
MTTRRLLPRSEWHRLAHTLLAQTWRHLPRMAQVTVVEKDGAIVACSALFPIFHQEGTWTAESERGNPAVGRLLMEGMREAIEDVGMSEVWMMATTPQTSALCARFGASLGTVTKLDAEHFAVSMENA